MKFAIIGGDRRQTETALYFKSIGHEATLFGLPNNKELSYSNSLCEAVLNADAVVLPLPVTRDGNTVSTPLTNDIIFLQDILLCRPNIIFGGLIKKEFTDELESRKIPYYDYYKSEALTVKNAVLTAEAAVANAVNCTDRSIFGSKALVIGYGRIGRILARYLKALGACVTATSRNEGTLAVIEADGFSAVLTEECGIEAQKYDYIFNTVPYPILDRTFFSSCSKFVFIEDLATNSGIDLAAAGNFGINAGGYSGLPGKHSPVTAAAFIGDEILKHLDSIYKSKGGNS